MALPQMTCAGGLSLLIGILAWPIATPAQGFCYMVNARGEVVNLDELCRADSIPAAPASGTATDRPASPTRFTVVGPLNSSADRAPDSATDSASDSAPDSAPNSAMDTGTATDDSPGGTAPGDASPAGAAPEPSDRLAIPQRDIPVPEIAVPQIPQPSTREATP